MTTYYKTVTGAAKAASKREGGLDKWRVTVTSKPGQFGDFYVVTPRPVLSDAQVKNRGYDVRNAIPEKSSATVLDTVRRNSSLRHGHQIDSLHSLEIKPGDVVKVEWYSNAGFNGIIAQVTTADGYFTNVPAGLLAPIR